jgi:hypothetical protein
MEGPRGSIRTIGFIGMGIEGSEPSIMTGSSEYPWLRHSDGKDYYKVADLTVEIMLGFFALEGNPLL